jgi:DNA helicase-2/ATP-dependent DNA helicase PcrA
LRQYGSYIGLNNYFSIYDDSDALHLLKRLYPSQPREVLVQYYHTLQRIKDGGHPVSDEFEQALYQNYQAALLASQAVDFGDLIAHPVHILQSHPSVRAKVQQHWQAILVDEYQDTNTIQAQWLSLLVQAETYLTVVGDEDQSIYQFRGADAGNILQFAHDYHPSTLIKLEQNYRSTPQILACANAIITHNHGRIGKTLYSHLADGAKPTVYATQDETTEADLICRLIKEAPLKETVVLYRTNAQNRIIGQYLDKYKIPYMILGGTKFYQREEIKAVLAWLRFLINHADHQALEYAWQHPKRKLGTKVMQLWQQSKATGLDKAADIINQVSAPQRQALHDFVQLIARLKIALAEHTLVDFVQYMVHEAGIYQYYKEIDIKNHTDRCENINELSTALATYAQGYDGLQDFLADALLDTQQHHDDASMPPVLLMTMHTAKGLEFERVFVAGMEENLFPHALADADIEEERRLCYVTITRAKQELFLFFTQKRHMFGQSRYSQPSRFLQEIGENLLTLMTSSDHEGNPTSTTLPSYSKGQWVSDPEYGIGQIIKSQVINQRLVIEVHFESGQKAKFLPEFRALQLLPAPDHVEF